MKSKWLLVCLLLLIFASGVVLSQDSGGDDTSGTSETDEYADLDFVIAGEIGRALPRTIIYDPVFERMAVVDAYGRLLLIDALTYDTERVLYERGNYRDIAFSHDGRWLALAIDTRIELYNAETGELAADLIDLGQAKQIVGPLVFSRDDTLLQFSGIYPAPRDIRIREDDTVTVPWLWHLPAARGEGSSTFPRDLEAWQFFDYKFGFFIGPNNRAVAALPGRLQVLDAFTLDVLFDIPTERYERDPLTLWYSLRDDQVYVRPVNFNSLIQVDTDRGVLVEIPLNTDLSQNDLELIGGIELSEQAQVIGTPGMRGSKPLLDAILGYDYRPYYAYDNRPLTVTLIDLVVPPTSTGDNVRVLVFIYDESRSVGRFVLSRSGNVQQTVISPDGEEILVRWFVNNDEHISKFDLSSGEQIDRFLPALRAIGRYSRVSKNRVLAYDKTGTIIVSDFQRYDAESNRVLAEDLRYSQRFDSFYFTNDSENVVTLSGTEWRVWNIATGEVVRREVLSLRGTIQATSSDGFRFLTRYTTTGGVEGVEIVDLNTNERKNVEFERLPARSVEQVYPNPTWTQFLILYSPNEWGQYYPGNEIALYDLERGKLWFMAGDDLPPIEVRQYGWVDDKTVYVYGEGDPNDQPARIFGLDYAPSGLPECAVVAFPDQVEQWVDLWERLVLRLRPDALHRLSQAICADLPTTPQEMEQFLVPTATPRFVTPTPIVVAGVPVCLTTKYPDEVERYTQIWHEVTDGLNDAEKRELETLLCEGIGKIEYFNDRAGEYLALTMMIDAETGVRASGAFQPQERIRRPTRPIQELFEQVEERAIGTFILSPDAKLIAASSLPGELVLYRLPVPYETLTAQLTATAVAQLERANLVGVLPSPTPTYNVVGTANPTLTPTITPTPIPRPTERVDQPLYGETEAVCPVERLYTLADAPDSYSPSGLLVARVLGDNLWVVNPVTGQRREDPTIPRCGVGIDCQFSPDKQWILASATGVIYLIRPDGSDERVLFAEDPPNENTPANWPPPSYINWSGPNMLEYEVRVSVERNGRRQSVTAFQRDILGVFPDPDPWIPEVIINDIRAELLERQPGGEWALARTTFSTGIGPGYKYYLYNTVTGEYTYFARVADEPPLQAFWQPLGDRLFYAYPPLNIRERLIWYQIDAATGTNRLLDRLPSGTWSNEGRYRAYSTNLNTQHIAVWDSHTGLTRTYCIPESGARIYSGEFIWSPDSRYLALRAPLPKDENTEGVGQHLLILDIETGEIVDVTTGIQPLVVWMREPGTYGGGR